MPTREIEAVYKNSRKAFREIKSKYDSPFGFGRFFRKEMSSEDQETLRKSLGDLLMYHFRFRHDEFESTYRLNQLALKIMDYTTRFDNKL
jgi:hypothetical protein